MRRAIILMLFLSNFLYSQTGAVRGIVKNQFTGEPISGVTVLIEGTPFGATTDKLGWFEIKDIPPGKYNLIVTALGFEQKRVEISIHPDEISYISISLGPRQELQRTNVQYLRPDPNHTRLFLAPTARSLKSGQGYACIYGSFFPYEPPLVLGAVDFAVGISNFITLGGGVTAFGSVAAAWFIVIPVIIPAFHIAPKITLFQVENFSTAIGGLFLIFLPIFGEGESETTGMYYGVATYGNDKISITAGLGFVQTSIILIGAEFRISNHTKFITENWLLPNSGPPIFGENGSVNYLSFGFRFFGERLAADLGLIFFTGLEEPFSPLIRLTYNSR